MIAATAAAPLAAASGEDDEVIINSVPANPTDNRSIAYGYLWEGEFTGVIVPRQPYFQFINTADQELPAGKQITLTYPAGFDLSFTPEWVSGPDANVTISAPVVADGMQTFVVTTNEPWPAHGTLFLGGLTIGDGGVVPTESSEFSDRATATSPTGDYSEARPTTIRFVHETPTSEIYGWTGAPYADQIDYSNVKNEQPPAA